MNPVYVFDSEQGLLEAFATREAALGGRDEAALRAQRWLFFDAAGQPLRVDVLLDGRRQMRPWASCASCTLAQLLPYVRSTGAGLDAAGLAALRGDASG
ncbi:MAG: hypothetical protein REI09_11335 [Candidatus Dactylopiibacterium sp.]|nr:hypothetical protein [Candidatus Dactylopiibacterium sp.]